MADYPIPNLLIVDNDRSLRTILSAAMQSEGYEAQEAADGQECLLLCQQQLPDIILLDAIMPGMDGFTCCTELHTRFGDRCPPILMITALSDTVSVDRAFAAGATDYVTKPIHWAVLRQRVKRILETGRTLIELHQANARIQELEQQLQQIRSPKPSDQSY